MKPCVAAIVSLVVGVTPAQAVSIPSAVGVRKPVEPALANYMNARQMFLWSDGAVYHVPTQPGMITDIALQPGEGLIAVAAGDTARWIIGDTRSGEGEAEQTHVLVKPFTQGLSTNLVITTNRRTYHLELTSAERDGMTALAWTYPLDAVLAVARAKKAAEASAPVAQGIGVEQLYFGYVITGDHATWRPVRAFDDGARTYIEFPASIGQGEAPPLFLVDGHGKAELVNYRMKGRFYIVDRIFEAAELRLGTKDQKVVRITRGGRP